MRILLVSTMDIGGGAEKVAFDLLHAYNRSGHDARMLVAFRKTELASVHEVDAYAYTSPWSSVFRLLDQESRSLPKFRGYFRMLKWLRRSAWPVRWVDHLRGIEDFNYPSTQHILDDPEWTPDVIHLHNIHGDFFDLRALPALSAKVPVVWTLHDMWSMTGHCGYTIDCPRWLSGCGNCPDLKRSPPIRRDGTAYNWQQKKQIYRQSQIRVATPSAWLTAQIPQSMLVAQECRVIPNGVDQSVYRPVDRNAVRQRLGLDPDSFICLYAVATGNQNNPYKDYWTVEEAVMRSLSELEGTHVQFICLGSVSATNQNNQFHYTGYLTDPEQVAMYYQAADVLLHAAVIDNFPCVVIESLACGTPVIATAVGGIPEQIVDGDDGFLVPPRDSAGMAQKITLLARNPELLAKMRIAAAHRAQSAFSLTRQAEDYLQWFEELLRHYQHHQLSL